MTYLQNFITQKKKDQTKKKVEDLVRTSNLKKIFLDRIQLIGLINSVKFQKIINETIPSYHFDNLPERYNETLLKNSKVSLVKLNVS